MAEEGQPFDRTGAPDIARTSLLRALAAASLTDRRRAVKAALEALATPPG